MISMVKKATAWYLLLEYGIIERELDVGKEVYYMMMAICREEKDLMAVHFLQCKIVQRGIRKG
jgi:hypothetical protein